MRWLLEWLFRAGDVGSGSLLSIWSWNRTTLCMVARVPRASPILADVSADR